nr:MAG TPA: hypothetical protein [Caudoviricetes sp.]
MCRFLFERIWHNSASNRCPCRCASFSPARIIICYEVTISTPYTSLAHCGKRFSNVNYFVSVLI